MYFDTVANSITNNSATAAHTQTRKKEKKKNSLNSFSNFFFLSLFPLPPRARSSVADQKEFLLIPETGGGGSHVAKSNITSLLLLLRVQKEKRSYAMRFCFAHQSPSIKHLIFFCFSPEKALSLSLIV